ncbi:B-cell scaffold protein with ankyrin repeats isoform X1 [Apteryx rowi]|uniref:B-cell scaffold protein with ankyrin repeats isoform X1 n=1 Tax=Apteryx rowi TaxID=308060 RepID=UPI000E1D6693|nr:B-cell scaffold protein with ankyrin repeats isoform X1 [Apteryx rowi]XP_025934242.1 B-cell scaffold protein with ankyrin repeats isoform X1 [Apteryx rowi]
MRPAEHTKDILVIYEQEAEEWALYLKTLFRHILNEEGILLYSLETSSVKHLELFSLSCYKCKLLILSCGLLKSLNQKRGYFLEQVLKPPDNVVILLCGVENSDILYDMLTLDGGSKEISTDQEPEEYLSIVTGIIQSGKPQNKNLEDSLSYVYEAVLADDYKNNTDVNLSNIRGASEETDLFLETQVVSETLETDRRSALVLPARISCENPGEIFILLKDEIDDETLEVEFIANNQRIRTQPASWNQKVKYLKALDFPAGPVYVNVYCGGVIKATTQIEYYTALGEIENVLKKVVDPIAFACQAFEFSSVEKLDNVLTLLLKSKMSAYGFSAFQSEEKHHQQANSHLEELPTLLHCAAKFGLKNLAALLLRCPKATQACNITNKDGDNPAGIAGKHGHEELQKLIRDFLINTADNFTNYEEEAEEDDTYVLMLGLETQPAITLKAKQNPGDQHRIGSRCQREAEVDEEKKDDVEDSGEEIETEHEEDKVREDSYSFDNNPDSLYANICGDDPEENRRDCFFYKMPPLPPPRNLPGTLRQDDLHNLPQERNLLEDRSEREHGDGDLTACYGEDQDTCEGEEEEEDPYTFAKLDESVYDMILADEEEKRKERRSFIVNRPPAPAPRPVCSPVREENTPYIVQVFQQKAARTPSDHNKMCCDVRKQAAHRGHADMVTYSTLKHTIPAEQEDLIRLQKQVKKGAISVDEALEKFKQWQNEKSRLQSAQQERVRNLRENNIGNRLEKDNLNVHKESRPESIHFRDLLYYMPFNKASPTRNPTDKEQMPN